MILFSSLFWIIFWNIISSVLGVTIVFKYFSLEMIRVIDPGTWWSVVSSHCEHCHHQHNTNCHNIVTHQHSVISVRGILREGFEFF